MFVHADTYGVIITNFELKEGKRMKSYRTKTSFHMTGKAWQIRIMLKQWMQETEPLTPLAEILKSTKGNERG